MANMKDMMKRNITITCAVLSFFASNIHSMEKTDTNIDMTLEKKFVESQKRAAELILVSKILVAQKKEIHKEKNECVKKITKCNNEIERLQKLTNKQKLTIQNLTEKVENLTAYVDIQAQEGEKRETHHQIILKQILPQVTKAEKDICVYDTLVKQHITTNSELLEMCKELQNKNQEFKDKIEILQKKSEGDLVKQGFEAPLKKELLSIEE